MHGFTILSISPSVIVVWPLVTSWPRISALRAYFPTSFMGIGPGRSGPDTCRRTTLPVWGTIWSGDGAFCPRRSGGAGAPVVVLGHDLWQPLGSDPKLIGEYITLNSTPCQVVGVAVEGFGGVTFGGTELWLPLGSYWTVVRFDPAWNDRDKDLLLNLVGRLKPEVTLSVAQTQLNALIPQFQREYPRRWRQWSSINLRPPGRTQLYGDFEAQLQEWAVASGVLMAVSATILAIACLNLANLLIVQGAAATARDRHPPGAGWKPLVYHPAVAPGDFEGQPSNYKFRNERSSLREFRGRHTYLGLESSVVSPNLAVRSGDSVPRPRLD